MTSSDLLSGSTRGLRLVLATRNLHKLEEFRRILRPYGIELQALPPDVVLPPEGEATFDANARPKARAAAMALGRPAVGDDSGIEAAALGGRPGVRSARFAGEAASDSENLLKLLREAPAGSGLRYVCVVAFYDPESGVEKTFRGECTGTVAANPAGSGGFGYDPAFVPDSDDPGEGRTFAELSETEKDAVSHRGRAARAFADWWVTAG